MALGPTSLVDSIQKLALLNGHHYPLTSLFACCKVPSVSLIVDTRTSPHALQLVGQPSRMNPPKAFGQSVQQSQSLQPVGHPLTNANTYQLIVQFPQYHRDGNRTLRCASWFHRKSLLTSPLMKQSGILAMFVDQLKSCHPRYLQSILHALTPSLYQHPWRIPKLAYPLVESQPYSLPPSRSFLRLFYQINLK